MSCSTVEATVFPPPSPPSGAKARLESTDSNPCSNPISESDAERGHDEEDKGEGKEKKRQEHGMQKAREREMVRQAARRLVVFGVPTGLSGAVTDEEIDHDEKADRADRHDGAHMQVEAVQGERVVEPSFAKGEWGVRWRT